MHIEDLRAAADRYNKAMYIDANIASKIISLVPALIDVVIMAEIVLPLMSCDLHDCRACDLKESLRRLDDELGRN